MFRDISLRKKIVLLSVLPALTACLIFTVLFGTSAHRASALVRQDISDFMILRTEKSLIHASNSADVAFGYVTKLLTLQMEIAEKQTGSSGGFKLTGESVPHQIAASADHMGGTVMMPAMSVAGEIVAMGRSERLREISEQTGAVVVLFQRVNDSSEFVRISASSPRVELGTFLSATPSGGGDVAARNLSQGQEYVGRTLEANGWHIGRYEPIHAEGSSTGPIIGALYMGVPVAGLKDFQDEAIGNQVGDHGSVVLLYVHGPQRGTMIATPKFIGADTQSVWLPKIMEQSAGMEPGKQYKMDVPLPNTNATAFVRYIYLQRFDWVLVTVADSRDFEQSGATVGQQFHALLLQSLIGAAIVLLIIGIVSTLISRRVVDPLLEITIQLTSNGTQVASSANQQLSHATSFNVSSTEIATAVKEISSTSQELLRAMEELSREAARASSIAQEGSAGLRGLGQSIEALSRATATISGSLAEIRNQASKINSVTLAVTKVADQTNLLSLNAAIEAERAGDAGAGFAVVAREIRRLADQSANSSQEIEQTVHEMHDAVASGVAEVQSLSAAVEQSVAVSDRIRQQFTEIISRVEAMTPRYEMVHLGMQNQTVGAQQISDAMWQLTESAGQTSEAIAELNQVSMSLHKAVGVLKKRIFQDESDPLGRGGLHG